MNIPITLKTFPISLSFFNLSYSPSPETTENSRRYKLVHSNFWFVAVVQLLSPVQLFATPMDCSRPGFYVLHHLPVLAQTHVHGVGDAIQPSHPLLSPPLLWYRGLNKKMSSGFDEDSSVGGSSWDLEPNIWAWVSTTAGSRAARKEPECQERVDIPSRDKIHKIVGHGPVQQVPGDVGRLAPSILQFWGLMGRKDYIESKQNERIIHTIY